MAFAVESTRTPTAINGITINVTTTGPNGAGGEVEYNVKVIFSDGSIVVRKGDLIPHIPQQIPQLIAFMDFLRQKAIDEFLP